MVSELVFSTVGTFLKIYSAGAAQFIPFPGDNELSREKAVARSEVGLAIVDHIKRGFFPVKPAAFTHLSSEIRNIKSAGGQLYVCVL
jgi:hypothetical protein